MRHILVIEERGHFITLSNIPPFRTPAKIDITKYDIDKITSELDRLSIKNYKIISMKNKIEKPKNSIEFEFKTSELKKWKPKITINDREIRRMNNEEDNKIDLSFMNSRLDNIENLLQELVNKEVLRKEPIIENLSKENDFDTFIPNIDVSNMEIKGETSTKKFRESSQKIRKGSELLSKIYKKKS